MTTTPIIITVVAVAVVVVVVLGEPLHPPPGVVGPADQSKLLVLENGNPSSIAPFVGVIVIDDDDRR